MYLIIKKLNKMLSFKIYKKIKIKHQLYVLIRQFDFHIIV